MSFKWSSVVDIQPDRHGVQTTGVVGGKHTVGCHQGMHEGDISVGASWRAVGVVVLGEKAREV